MNSEKRHTTRRKEIQFEPKGLREPKAYEWMVRFVFGGLVSLVAGIVGQKWGPVVGGLFLGFPSILPATVTLVKKHNGREEAARDVRGSTIGSIALVVFALIVCAAAKSWGPLATLGAATLGWCAVSLIAWRTVE